MIYHVYRNHIQVILYARADSIELLIRFTRCRYDTRYTLTLTELLWLALRFHTVPCRHRMNATPPPPNGNARVPYRFQTLPAGIMWTGSKKTTKKNKTWQLSYVLIWLEHYVVIMTGHTWSKDIVMGKWVLLSKKYVLKRKNLIDILALVKCSLYL